MKRFLYNLLWTFMVTGLIAGVVHSAGAEEETTQEEAPAKVKKRTKKKRGREKEADGTEAPNRFEADTVIKSQYRLNGEHLEVDPD